MPDSDNSLPSQPVSKTVTLVFTDLQGSTSLKERVGDDRASSLIESHCELVLRMCESEEGRVVNNPGDGFFLTFEKPSQAVRFALKVQYAHAQNSELPGVRIGIHHGEVNVSDGLVGFLGIEVDTAARVEQLARPGQILVSSSAFKSAKARVRDIENGKPVQWEWYGEYRLKGVEDPLALGEVGFAGISPFTPPPRPQPPAMDIQGGEGFVPNRDDNPLLARHGKKPADSSRSTLIATCFLLLFGAGVSGGYFAGLYQATKTPSKAGDVNDKVQTLSSQLESANTKLTTLEQTMQPPALKDYLQRVIIDRTNGWGGKFEQLYTSGTMFMLTPKATHSNLMGVYGRIIRWRLDIDKLDQKEKVLLSLTGYAHEAEVLSEGETPGHYINSRVDRLLFDKDLLNCDLDLQTSPLEQKGILVLGEPAAGKTTLLKFLELEAARRALGDRSAFIPVRIELGQLESGTHRELLDKIDNIGKRGENDYSGKFLLPPAQKYLLLIDALDEAPDTLTAAQACIELAKDARVGRMIVTSRIINYDVLLRDSKFNLAEQGFRTCLYYGHSLAAVEKRILTERQSEQRQNLLDLLASSEKRAVWLQFFRLPAHFNFACDFLLDADVAALESPNRIRLLQSYLGSLMKKRDWEGVRPSQSEVDNMLSRLAGYVFQTPSRSFADFQVREAVETGSSKRLNDEEWAKIQILLAFAKKVGIIESIQDNSYRFRHAQFLEYYTARSDVDWQKVDPTDVNWREVLLFKAAIGDEEARALVKRMSDLVKQAAAQSGSVRPDDYLTTLAIQCIDGEPFRKDVEFTQIREELKRLSGQE